MIAWAELSVDVSRSFCRKVKAAGFSIWADLSVMSGHITQEERGHKHFLSYIVPEPYPWLDRTFEEQQFDDMWLGEGLISDMAEYLHLKPEELVAALEDHPELKVRDEWGKCNPVTPDEVADFYKHCPAYLLDLTMWNASPTFRSITEQMPSVKDKVVLDFGGGLGSLACWMVTRKAKRVDYLDIPDGCLENFAKWRATKQKVSAALQFLPCLDGRGQYDLIVAIDVFEHLPDIHEKVDALARALRVGGEMFCHCEWDNHNGVYPQHFDWSGEWDALLESNNLKVIAKNENIYLLEKVA